MRFCMRFHCSVFITLNQMMSEYKEPLSMYSRGNKKLHNLLIIKEAFKPLLLSFKHSVTVHLLSNIVVIHLKIIGNIED